MTMPQFDVFTQKVWRNQRIPYLISLQNDLMDDLDTVVVAPLRRIDGTPAVSRLNPILEVGGEKLIFVATEILHARRQSLGAPVANLALDRDRIVAALDVLFTGI